MIAHALPPLPPVAYQARADVARVLKVTQDRRTSLPAVAWDDTELWASMVQPAATNPRRYPDCPLGIPGWGFWKATYTRTTIRCVAVFERKGFNHRVVYKITPRRHKSTTTVTVTKV